MNRAERKAVAESTLRILDQGFYDFQSKRIFIKDSADHCVAATRVFGETGECSSLESLATVARREDPLRVEVADESTLTGAACLATASDGRKVGVLNFASATNPGDGFLRGSNAQEESLARSSGLFPSLQACPEFYDEHRRGGNGFYSDRIIHSPNCPVFRDDAGALLEEPYAVDFFTCAAPNYQRIRKETPAASEEVQDVLNRRAKAILMLAAKVRVTHLVLGAWGCGVFACPPAWVAGAFHAAILPAECSDSPFRSIRFSILAAQGGDSTLQEFARVFPF